MKFIDKFLKRNDAKYKDENRNDDFANFYTNIGTQYSRTGQTNYIGESLLSQITLENLYRSDGIARRIVDIPVDDAMRNFIECDNNLLKELLRLKTKVKFLEAGSFGRLFGGSLIVAFIDDGLDLEKPVQENKIQRIVSLKVFDKYQITYTQKDLNQDMYSEHFGEPEIYTISNHSKLINDNNQSSFKVHRSRCFAFGGCKITNKQRNTTNGWDDSVIQSVYNALRNYSIINNAYTEIVQDFIQIIFKIKDLGMKLAQKEGWQDVQKRLSIFNSTRSVTGAGFIDADGEDYEKKSSSVTGLPELSDRSARSISAVTGIPMTKLFGISPAGLNATGDSDLQIYYDAVRSYRSDQIEPALQWLINLVKNQKKWTEKASNYNWRFSSLTNPSESEWADIKKKYAEIDNIYATLGAIDPVEAWQKRFGEGKFNIDIELSKPELNNDLNTHDEELLNIINAKENQNTAQANEEKKINDIIDSMYLTSQIRKSITPS